MATKTITITEDAYRRLAGLRNGNESFSEIITKVTGKKVRLMDYFGILSDEAGEALEDEVMKRRKRHNNEHKKRVERIVRSFQ